MGRLIQFIPLILFMSSHAYDFHDARTAIRTNNIPTHISDQALQKTDPNGNSLLHYAVSYQRPYFIQYFLSKGLSPNFRNQETFSPFHVALRNDDPITVAMLLEYGASQYQKDPDGDFPIHYAAQYNKPWLISMLAQFHSAAVDITQTTEDTQLAHETPLHRAICVDARQATYTLLYHGANTALLDRNNRTFLHYALELGRNKIADTLLESTPLRTSDEAGYFPIHRATQSGHTRIIARMLATYPNLIDQKTTLQGNTPLHLARNADMAKFLIKNEAHITACNHTNQTPLIYHTTLHGAIPGTNASESPEHESIMYTLMRHKALAQHLPDNEHLNQLCQTTDTTTLTQTQYRMIQMFNSSIYMHPRLVPTPSHHKPPFYARIPYYRSVPLPDPTPHQDPMDFKDEKNILSIIQGIYHYSDTPSFLISRLDCNASTLQRLKYNAYTLGCNEVAQAISQYQQHTGLEELQKSSYLCDIDIHLSK